MKTVKEKTVKQKEETTRFDARIPKSQKHLFEEAARLKGYKNLTTFILVTVQERATEILNQQNQILASNRDSEIFFDAIINPPTPNSALKSAAQEYMTQR